MFWIFWGILSLINIGTILYFGLTFGTGLFLGITFGIFIDILFSNYIISEYIGNRFGW